MPPEMKARLRNEHAAGFAVGVVVTLALMVWLLPTAKPADLSDLIPAEYTAQSLKQPSVEFELSHVHDADTIIVIVPTWPELFRKISVRLSGVDAPEKGDTRYADKFDAGKRRLETLLVGAKKLRLDEIKRDKYFRLNANVLVGDKSATQILLEEGYVRPYDGRGPKPW